MPSLPSPAVKPETALPATAPTRSGWRSSEFAVTAGLILATLIQSAFGWVPAEYAAIAAAVAGLGYAVLRTWLKRQMSADASETLLRNLAEVAAEQLSAARDRMNAPGNKIADINGQPSSLAPPASPPFRPIPAPAEERAP